MQIRIGKGIWVILNVIIAQGVTIGDQAVIATNFVVKKIPLRTLVVKILLKVLKDFNIDVVYIK